MHSYYDYELLAKQLIERRLAEAEHDHLVRQAQLSAGVARGGLWAALLALRWRLPSRRAHANVLCLEETVG